MLPSFSSDERVLAIGKIADFDGDPVNTVIVLRCLKVQLSNLKLSFMLVFQYFGYRHLPFLPVNSQDGRSISLFERLNTISHLDHLVEKLTVGQSSADD